MRNFRKRIFLGMKTTFLWILSVCVFSADVVGQVSGSVQTGSGTQSMAWDKTQLTDFVHQMNKSIALGDVQIPVSEIEGSMYYEQDFVKGNLYLGKSLYRSYLLRYNAYLDRFEVKTGQGQLPRSVAKGSTLSFEIGGDTFVLMDYMDSKNQVFSGYLMELVADGKYRLYQEKRKFFKRGKKAQTSFHKSSPHRFMDYQCFYVYSGRGYPKQLKNSTKSLKDVFGNDGADKLKRYIKENDIKLNDREDLIQLVDFLNSRT